MSHSATDRIRLAEDEVHVWYALPGELAAADAPLVTEGLLSTEELATSAKFVQERDELLYVVAHALLRRVLSHYTDIPPHAWQFRTGPYGKPELAGPLPAGSLQFNLSHTPGLVACAVSAQHPVGIDVELVERAIDVLSLATRFFSLAEADRLQRTPPDGQRILFYRYWTLKEAFIKALGAGLSVPLESFTFELPEDERSTSGITEAIEISTGPLAAPIKELSRASIDFNPIALASSLSEASGLGRDILDFGQNPADWRFAQFAPTESHLLAVGFAPGHGQHVKLELHQASHRFITAGQ